MVSASRRWRTALLGAAATVSLLLPQGVAQAAPGADKIDKALRTELSQGSATFLVRLKGGADLSAAARAKSKDDKAAQVFKAKTSQADAAQAGLRRLLTEKKAEFTPLWVVNAVKVTGDAGLAAEVAKLPEVESVEPDTAVKTLNVSPAAAVVENKEAKDREAKDREAKDKEVKAAKPTAGGVGWNLEAIGAPKVWNEYGIRGDGIVVASLDSGVNSDHPGLQSQYRGRKTDGTVDHNYNWYDPDGKCPGDEPCYAGYRGLPSLGVIVGSNPATDDKIGVAPGATWIAARGCEALECRTSTLIQAGQWLLAPTDLNGRNPRPDLAPDIVNNEWTDYATSDWFGPVVDAWTAAGIFSVFAGGDKGTAGCNTVRSPASGDNAYSVGKMIDNGLMHNYSSRGTGPNGEIKPNIGAPGDGASLWIGNEFQRVGSVAAAHVAGTVALMWSAAPALRGDVAATRALLDRTAVDVDDTSCGGTPAKNNVWGEGRLDAYTAVRDAPVGPAGGVKGTVSAGGSPAASVQVSVAGPVTAQAVTGPDGAFNLPRLPAGTYEFTARKYGYGANSASLVIAADQTVSREVSLSALPTHVVSGTVTADGKPETGASVAVEGAPAAAVTDAAGRYRLTVPSGDHDLTVAPRHARCADSALARITVNGDLAKDVALPRRSDTFGYTCTVTTGAFATGTDKHPQSGGDFTIELPFAFPFYGGAYRTAWVHKDGYVSFQGHSNPEGTVPIPSPGWIDATIYPFWHSYLYSGMQYYTATTGTAPNRTFTIEWRDLTWDTLTLSVSLVLSENGTMRFHYKGADARFATIGIENADGTDAFQFVRERAGSLVDNQVVTFAPSRHGLLTGTVVDANDRRPLAGATVTAGESTMVTGADGVFVGHVPPGDHQVVVSKEHYGTVTQTATVRVGEWARADASLVTGSVSASVSEVELVTPVGSTTKGTFKLTNLGTSAATYAIEAEPVQRWLSVSPANGELAPGASVTVTATADSVGVAPGTFRAGKLRVRSSSGRAPVAEIPVTMAVPRHQVAVDVGGTRDVTDSEGDRWTADRAYTAGGHGHMGTRTRVATTSKAIRDTGDQELFKRAREGMLEYRFDGLPVGTYSVELGFAEVRGTRPGRRVFDVMAEGQIAVPALDLAAEVGTHTATVRRYTVKVVDGQLNLRFAAQVGAPILNAVRVVDRPDRATP
ncbi:Serine protease, subtilisin family [Sinosporangium album]|uniref:alpha-amylase n=1 Tax=Sinosporangium album TaxID=504805 RepID=A0A1G8BNN1_9ACTN|nr:carboxypeptidase regulatory-like domain-containing protein [Sinosporangium album]SDH34786.1 Serine protease, subtilisin family [Sinosporangium album]